MALFRSLIDKCKLSTSLRNSTAQTKTVYVFPRGTRKSLLALFA